MSIFNIAGLIIITSAYSVFSSPVIVHQPKPYLSPATRTIINPIGDNNHRHYDSSLEDYVIPPGAESNLKISNSLVPPSSSSSSGEDIGVNYDNYEPNMSSHDISNEINDMMSNDIDNNVHDSSIDILKKLVDDIKDEEEIAIKSAYLINLLQNPTNSPLPVLYVENENISEMEYPFDMEKRSGRYYRRYPWKRQNSRYRPYEAESRYLCVPSREDVFKLLVSLHENRNGNHQKTVNFCNRKRPAKAIFTNIRFLG